MAARTEAEEVRHQTIVKRVQLAMVRSMISGIKLGQAAGRKWAEEEAEYVELVRFKDRVWERTQEDGNIDLDDIDETTPIYSFRYLIGDTVPETLERLLDPDPTEARDWEEFWDRVAPDVCGDPCAWFALGFIHAAAEVFAGVEKELGW